MATENHRSPHAHERASRLPDVIDEDVAITGNNAIVRLRQGTPPLAESRVLAVRAHLERVLHSPHFDASTRSREFLQYVVEEVLAGRVAYLKQAAIAVEVFGRKPDFDAVIDPIVRVQAGRLRRSLERYYLLSGDTDAIRIELPKGSYAPVFVETPDLPAPPVSMAQPAQTWPTVIVHPFEAHDAHAATLATQLKEELAAELCRYGMVRVTLQRDIDSSGASQQAPARFELHGSIFDSDRSPVIATRLMDRTTGQQIWADEFHTGLRAERWSGSVTDIGRVIAARIGAEHGIIARHVCGEFTARGFPAGDTFGAIARSQHLTWSRQPSALLPAVEALQQATSRAPEVELAWTSLARLYLMNHTLELSGVITPLETAIGCANQSVMLEPASARTRCLMATALLVKGELGAARRQLEHALRLNSESLAYREVIGWLLALTGEWGQGVALMRSAMERNPYCHPCVSHGLWADAMWRGEFDAAYAAALDYHDAGFFWRELMITSCLGHLGRPGDAHASAAELMRVKPLFGQHGRRLIAYYIKPDELRATIIDGLRKAGVDVV